MGIDSSALVAILGMAAVTYFTRVIGLWLARRIEPSERMARALGYVSGTVIASIVAPNVLTKGPIEMIGAVVTVLVGLVGGSLPIAMAAGVAAVWLGRQFGGF